MTVQVRGVDYLSQLPERNSRKSLHARFQYDTYCLWYQIDGHGILQNLSRNIFGTARPGLLGIMEQGQRYSYLHQKGTFECFMLMFSLMPSGQAKCYWNTGIEGKTKLDGAERLYFENLIFDLFLMRARQSELHGIGGSSRLLEIMGVLFKKGILVIKEEQFPKNKPRSLIAKAKRFMEQNYTRTWHQNELERECGVDINYLNMLFRKETGSTLYRHLTRVRMEHAKHLLETTGENVAAIAAKTGYPNANSFSRVFRRQEKKTPLDHRRQSRSGVWL
ncbi:MAG: helix-turn-helix transcriptional regulator [Chitinispirillaceae bacterium]|nr:helix-turn-helix transcriptional regulator [Chitinispirillaceae bacterium]